MKKNVWFICLVCFLICCDSQRTEWQGTIEVVDGVSIVKNPREPMFGENALVLDEELIIGEAEGREEYMFSGLKQFTVDDFGNIYALDVKEKHIKVFSDDGQYVMTISKGGQGPGELRVPAGVGITAKKDLIVIEMMAVSYFTLSGDFIHRKNTSAQGVAMIQFDKFNNPIGIRVIFAEENPRNELVKFNQEFEPVYVYRSSPLFWENNPEGTFNPFMPVLRWSVIRGEKIVCGHAGYGYKLELFDLDGKLLKKIEKPYDKIRITEEDIELQMRRRGLESRDRIFAPGYKPPFKWIYSDEEGRFFVSTWDRIPDSESYRYDVFDADGRYLLSKPIEGEPLVFKNGKLYLIFIDDDGYQYIKRYKVTWNY